MTIRTFALSLSFAMVLFTSAAEAKEACKKVGERDGKNLAITMYTLEQGLQGDLPYTSTPRGRECLIASKGYLHAFKSEFRRVKKPSSSVLKPSCISRYLRLYEDSADYLEDVNTFALNEKRQRKRTYRALERNFESLERVYNLGHDACEGTRYFDSELKVLLDAAKAVHSDISMIVPSSWISN